MIQQYRTEVPSLVAPAHGWPPRRQGPDRQRRVGWQGLARRSRDEQLQASVAVHIGHAVQMVLGEIKTGLAAERIDADYMPLTIALVVVDAVHQFKAAIAIYINEGLRFGPHHFG